MSSESKTITVEVKVTIPECGAAAAVAPSVAAPTEPDIGTGTKAEEASGRIFSKSEIDAGHTGYRIHQLWADLGGTTTSVGFLFITNNSYDPDGGSYLANRDYWVWPETAPFPDTFYLAPDSLTQNKPAVPNTHTAIECKQVPFVVQPTEPLPAASSVNYKMWQVSRRNNPFTTSWNPRKIFLLVENGTNKVTWWAKNESPPGISEISSADYLKLFGDESLRFTRITTNPADTTGYRKAVT